MSTTDEKASPAQSSPVAARLLQTYLARQDELRGFYRARLGPQADIEDLVQDLYVKIRGLEDQEVRNAPAFLYRLAHNHMLDWLRRGRRSRIRDDAWRQASHTASGPVDVADDPDAETTLIARQRLERIGLALRALPPRTQEIFRLHKIEGLSYAETAQRLGLAKKSIEKHMSAALAHLYAKVGR